MKKVISYIPQMCLALVLIAEIVCDTSSKIIMNTLVLMFLSFIFA